MMLGSIASFVAARGRPLPARPPGFGPSSARSRRCCCSAASTSSTSPPQGYLDISYVALIVWAVVLEVERPRRGTPVFLLLAPPG